SAPCLNAGAPQRGRRRTRGKLRAPRCRCVPLADISLHSGIARALTTGALQRVWRASPPNCTKNTQTKLTNQLTNTPGMPRYGSGIISPRLTLTVLGTLALGSINPPGSTKAPGSTIALIATQPPTEPSGLTWRLAGTASPDESINSNVERGGSVLTM